LAKMLVNNKFRPLPSYPENPPIKKTYDYYKESGNLWNSKYLSSKKISRYYLDTQQSFLSGPNSPENQSLQTSILESRKYAQKAEIHKKQSQDLLNKRKIERLQLSNTHSSINSQKKTEFNNSGTLNAWKNIEAIPESRLKHVIPVKLIEKDKEGIENILSKSYELSKLAEWRNHQTQVRKQKDRLALISRHTDKERLEQRSGILKIRKREVSQGVFGYTKKYKFQEKTEFLSKPKQNPDINNFIHKDFRGLICADHPELVQKVYFSRNSPTSTLKSKIDPESSIKSSEKPSTVDFIEF